MRDVRFPSRVDKWLVVALGIGLGMPLYQAGVLSDTNPPASLIAIAVAAALVGLLFIVAIPCTYTLTQTHLEIRSGLIRMGIPYADITAVEPSRSLWSAPALSLRRVKVSFSGRFQLVSPSQRERFIQELQERVRALKEGPTQ